MPNRVSSAEALKQLEEYMDNHMYRAIVAEDRNGEDGNRHTMIQAERFMDIPARPGVPIQHVEPGDYLDVTDKNAVNGIDKWDFRSRYNVLEQSQEGKDFDALTQMSIIVARMDKIGSQIDTSLDRGVVFDRRNKTKVMERMIEPEDINVKDYESAVKHQYEQDIEKKRNIPETGIYDKFVEKYAIPPEKQRESLIHEFSHEEVTAKEVEDRQDDVMSTFLQNGCVHHKAFCTMYPIPDSDKMALYHLCKLPEHVFARMGEESENIVRAEITGNKEAMPKPFAVVSKEEATRLSHAINHLLVKNPPERINQETVAELFTALNRAIPLEERIQVKQERQRFAQRQKERDGRSVR